MRAIVVPLRDGDGTRLHARIAHSAIPASLVNCEIVISRLSICS